MLVDFLVGRFESGHVAEYLDLMTESLSSVDVVQVAPYRGPNPPAGRVGRYVRFARVAWSALRRGDLLVLHTPEARDVLVLWVLTRWPGARRGSAIMMMRRGPDILIGRLDWRARLIERLVRSMTSLGVLRLVSDSAAAARTWENLTGTVVPVLPLPLRRAFRDVASSRRRATRPLRVTLFGLFREEKGIDRYETVIQAALDADPDIEVWCQIGDAPLDDVERQVNDTILRRFAENPRVRLHAGHLRRDEYDRWLLETDIVVLPYRPELYTSGTSGALFDAISAGAVVVTTRFTWGVEEFGDHPAMVWLNGREPGNFSGGLAEAVSLARARRDGTIPVDPGLSDRFAEGWRTVIEAPRREPA